MPIQATDLHRRAFLLAIFGNHEGYISADYLDEKVMLALKAKTTADLLGPLDEENKRRFHTFHAQLVAG